MRVRAKKAMGHLLVPGLLLLGATPVWAQTGKVTGIVTDGQTGEPIAGVQIYVEELERGVLTQENGRYFLINLPVGNYTVVAEIIGYATVRKENVAINVDVTRQLNFQLPFRAVEIEEVVVEVESTPLIDVEATGARDVVTAAEIEALPVTDLKEVLALQLGFIDLPDNTDVVADIDVVRGLEPVHIRGGRPDGTITLIDGIPVNNFVFGSPSFFVNRSAVQQLDYIRGGFDAQYGNALSGVINIATKEGGTELRGAAEYQGSGLSGALGSEYDDLRNYRQAEGYVSGPVPGTDNRLRFMVAGREIAGASRVLQFDERVYNPLQYVEDQRGNFESPYDLLPGWRSLGFDNTRDLFGKLSFYFTPLAKLNFTFLDYRRQRQPFRFEWLQVGFDLVDQCKQLYPDWEDVCERIYLGGSHVTRMEDLRRTNQEQQYVLQSSINLKRQLLVGKWDHNLSARTRYTIAVGQFKQSRNNCTFLSGVCLQDHLAHPHFNGPFTYTGQLRNYGRHPVFGTDWILGGEDLTTNVARADFEWQATDHHNVRAGVFYQHHDVSFLEGQNVGLANVRISFSEYYAKPWDAAFYVQDKIEYDFITVSLGLRFDYGKASGLAFVDPRDPTNGTTALQVCNDPTAFGLPADQFTYEYKGQVYTGCDACSVEDAEGDGELLSYAADVAFQDDYGEAPSRTQLSPRIGISFPVTASSSFMFNAGRYAQNPTLHNLYRGTGIGTDLEATRTVQAFFTGPPGQVALLGNPRLPTERTTLYEFGYIADLFDGRYGLSLVLYNKDQSGLTGFHNGGYRPDGSPVYDPAATYRSTQPFYDVLLNVDHQTSRGLEFSLRRRLANYWGFDLRYSFAQVRTNAAPPDLEHEKQSEGDPPSREEIRSTIDLPHVFNAVARFAVGRETPDIPLGGWLRFFSASAIIRISSGIPYTPQLDFEGSQRLERNSGTSPTNYTVDLRASKDWRLSNMRFGIFMNVFNLFNTENCLQVFPSTGRCDGGAITQAREFGRAAAENTISQAWDRPDYVARPRSINVGARLSF